MILHLDIDAFAVSVEQALDPSLAGRPVIVGNNFSGRGIVACASYEARRCGIRHGCALGRARRLLPNAVFLPENPPLYEEFSCRLLQLLRSSAPIVEAATLDDFYLDLAGCERLFGGNMSRWAAKLRDRILKETGLPVTAGLASNKMLARVATLLAKTGHVCEVMHGREGEFLSPLSVELLPGVGCETAMRLREFGIRRIGQLASMEEEPLRVLFGPGGSELRQRANGQFSEPVRPSALHRFLVHEHVFPEDTARPEAVDSAGALLAQKLAFDLRRNRVRSAGGEVRVVYSDGQMMSHRVKLGYPSDQDLDFIQAVNGSLRAAFQRRVRIRKIILRSPFVPLNDSQFDLFLEKAQNRRRSLYQAIDAVRLRHGFDAILAARTISSNA